MKWVLDLSKRGVRAKGSGVLSVHTHAGTRPHSQTAAERSVASDQPVQIAKRTRSLKRRSLRVSKEYEEQCRTSARRAGVRLPPRRQLSPKAAFSFRFHSFSSPAELITDGARMYRRSWASR